VAVSDIDGYDLHELRIWTISGHGTEVFSLLSLLTPTKT